MEQSTFKPSVGVVKVVIQHHLSPTHEMSDSDWAKNYAKRVITLLPEPEGYFGFVTNREIAALERVRKACAELERSFDALSETSILRINAATNLKLDHPVARETRFQTNMAGSAAKIVLSSRSELPRASKRRNWRIAAVAGVCREIWADVEWRTKPEKYGGRPEFNALAENFYTLANKELRAL